jgi:2-polyprenyl-6-methoxyphenol hydroxylase-like FAD-dependent oxidoreductase
VQDGVDGKAKAIFKDGTHLSADLIVGCDGPRSIVRQALVGATDAAVTKMDVHLLNFPASYDKETAMLIRSKHPIFFNSLHEEGWLYWLRVQDVVDPNDPTSWSFQNIFSWTGRPYPGDLPTQAERTAWLKAKAEKYVDPWRSVLRALRDDVTFGIDTVSLWRPIDWSSSSLAGRVTLAGDAAHCMPPFRGEYLMYYDTRGRRPGSCALGAAALLPRCRSNKWDDA